MGLLVECLLVLTPFIDVTFCVDDQSQFVCRWHSFDVVVTPTGRMIGRLPG